VTLYADTAAHRTRQVLGDLLTLGLRVLAVVAGRAVYRQLNGLAGQTRSLGDAATASTGQLRDGVANLGTIPLVGDQLSGLLGQVQAFTGQTAVSLHGQAAKLHTEAVTAGMAVAVVGVLVVAAVWLLTRARWVRRASLLRRGGPDAEEALALSALVHASPRLLHALGSGLTARWRAGDPTAVRSLAAVERTRMGIRQPR